VHPRRENPGYAYASGQFSQFPLAHFHPRIRIFFSGQFTPIFLPEQIPQEISASQYAYRSAERHGCLLFVMYHCYTDRQNIIVFVQKCLWTLQIILQIINIKLFLRNCSFCHGKFYQMNMHRQ